MAQLSQIFVKNLLLEEFDFNVICKAYDYLNHFLFLHCFFYNDRAKETEGTMSSFSSSTSTSTYDVNPSSIFRKSWGQSGFMKLTIWNGIDVNKKYLDNQQQKIGYYWKYWITCDLIGFNVTISITISIFLKAINVRQLQYSIYKAILEHENPAALCSRCANVQ